MEKGYIYKITNNINGKAYIGQTRQSVSRRWTEHKRDYKKYDFIIYRAMKKHRVENFTIETLETVPNVKDLNEREVFWIDKLSTFGYGYNATTGGGQNTRVSESTLKKMSMATRGRNNPMYGKTHTKEVREIISRVHKGKTMSAESRRKMSSSRIGVKNHFYGKSHTEETKEKLRQWNIGRKHTDDSKLKMSLTRQGDKHHNYGKRGRESTYSVPVYQYDENWNFLRKFDTVKEALQFLGMKGHTQLNKAIKNKTMYKNYHWSKSSVETIETTSVNDGRE